MALLINLVSTGLILVGCFFLFTATFGLFRLPDVFTRLHATTKCDTVAAFCLLSAVALKSGELVVWLKLGLIFTFILIISPAVAHLVAYSATLEGDEYDA